MRLITAALSCLILHLAESVPFGSQSGESRLNDTSLRFYPAPDPNGIGVLVVPGGSYQFVSLDYEGADTTAYLNERGYDAWVLNYSTADTAPTPLYPLPLEQGLAAVRHIRAQNRVSKLGIWGYSAGGHLAAMTVTNPDANLDFGILAYPVITMDPEFTHQQSRTNLIGSDPSPELQLEASAETRVTESTPPIFLFHTSNDPAVPIQNALLFSDAMAAKKRKFQSLILPDGPHGICLALSDPILSWTPELERWMKYSI